MIRDERQGARDELQVPPSTGRMEMAEGENVEKRRIGKVKEECACALPLCVSSIADGEHKEDHKDHQQHGHPGAHEPVHQAFLDAPVAVFPAVPVSIGGQAAGIGEGAERRVKSQSLLRPHGHLARCKFAWSSEETNGWQTQVQSL